MEDKLQELQMKKKEIWEQSDALIEYSHQKKKEYRRARDSGDEEHASRLYDEIEKIWDKIYKLDHMIEKIDDEIKSTIPPVKKGKLVDLRANNDGSMFDIYIHNQPVKIGKIEYRDYHCSEYLGDIGYSIEEEYRNHGYATEALTLLSEKLCEEGIPDFWICVHKDNIGSIKVVEKNGGKLLKSEGWTCLYVVSTKLRNFDKNSGHRTR